MIVKSLADVVGTAFDVHGPGWNSRRLLLKDDGMGFSMAHTVIEAGAELTLEYKNHLEACYCISGRGSICDTATGKTHPLSVGTVYALNQRDHHTLCADAETNMHLICVFNPPLSGREVHEADGSYSLD